MGLSQNTLLSSQCCDKEDVATDNISEHDSSDDQPFFSRVKPVFNEILKQVETNPSLSNDVYSQFQEILYFTKHENCLQLNDKKSEENNNSDSIVSYHGNLDNRHRAKRFKYGWEK